MRYYPIFLDVRGRRTVVVGGGKVAERKVRKLLRARAVVRVISPELTPGLVRLGREYKIQLTRRRFRKGDLGLRRANTRSPLLVFAATDDPSAQRTVWKDANGAGALVNVADNAADCDFIVPASFTRGSLHVAISTSATDPALAQLLRRRLSVEMRKIKRKKVKGKRHK